MDAVERDLLIRRYAFDFVEELGREYGGALPFKRLEQGFEFQGRRITLIGAEGIWKPRELELPISITTSWRDPYGDELTPEGYLAYKYRRGSPTSGVNTRLRECFELAVPLIYFRGLEPGWYGALWPVFLIHDDPVSRTVTVACEDIEILNRGNIDRATADNARRRYVTRVQMVRLHQDKFRQDVLAAYRRSCTVCRLGHTQLLDAAHILGDRHEHGDPVIPNGLAMCKIHHAAFDSNILGIRPDHVVEIRSDILEERDGPMLRHGLQELHGSNLLVIPRRPEQRPDAARLEERYEEFRAAG